MEGHLRTSLATASSRKEMDVRRNAQPFVPLSDGTYVQMQWCNDCHWRIDTRAASPSLSHTESLSVTPVESSNLESSSHWTAREHYFPFPIVDRG
jgi:hypothetical protein